METPKQAVLKLLEDLPDEVTYDDLIYHLYVRSKIDRALKAVEQGPVHDHKEVKEEFMKWDIR